MLLINFRLFYCLLGPSFIQSFCSMFLGFYQFSFEMRMCIGTKTRPQGIGVNFTIPSKNKQTFFSFLLRPFDPLKPNQLYAFVSLDVDSKSRTGRLFPIKRNAIEPNHCTLWRSQNSNRMNRVQNAILLFLCNRRSTTTSAFASARTLCRENRKIQSVLS